MNNWPSNHRRARAIGLTCAVLTSSLLLSACGGGGGSPNKSDTIPPGNDPTLATTVSSAPVRQYSEGWTVSQSTTRYTEPASSSPTKRTLLVQVDAALPDGTTSVSTTDQSNSSATTELLAANGHQLASGSCQFLPARIVIPEQLTADQKTWASKFTERCRSESQVQVTGTVDGSATYMIDGTAYPVLKVHYTLTRQPVVDLDRPAREDATCLWSPTLHLNMQCSRDMHYASATPPLNAETHVDTALTAYSAGAGTPPAATASSYPAVQPDMPQATTVDGNLPTVLAAPKLLPVFFPHTDDMAVKAAFLGRLTQSSIWSHLAQYGVGAGTALPQVTLATDPAASISTSDIQQWLITQVQQKALSVDPSTMVVLFYPKATAIHAAANGPASCTPGGNEGFHEVVKLSDGTLLPYAVIPDCDRGIGSITMATSHEVLEGMVDPTMHGLDVMQGDISWSLAFYGAEIGDMCERLSQAGFWTADGDHIARIWSNEAAKAHHDPCGVDADARVAFFSRPVLTDTVQMQYQSQGGKARGVVVQPGASVTIPIELFSDGPTYGDWRVSVVALPDANGATPVTFSLDRQHGHNGDKLQLTITAPNAPLPDGVLFEVVSSYAGRTSLWTGAVGNSAASSKATTWMGGAASATPVDGTGSSAVFGYITGMSLTPSGNLILADYGRERTINTSTGQVVSTIYSGSSAARFGVFATAVATDNIYYTLSYTRPDPSTATLTRTLQAFVIGRNNTIQPTTLATDPANITNSGPWSQSMVVGPDGLLYLVDPAHNQVQRFDQGAWKVWAGQVAGSSGDQNGSLTQAAFNKPMALVFDADGNAYLSDTGNHKIRRITPDGQVTTFSGSGTAGIVNGSATQARYGYPTALTFDTKLGVLYVADGNFIRALDLTGRASTVVGGDLGYYFTALAVNGQGLIYAGTGGRFTGVVKITP